MSQFRQIRKFYQTLKSGDSTLDIWLWAIAFVTVFGFIAQTRNTLGRGGNEDQSGASQYASFQTQRQLYGLQIEENKARPSGPQSERLETGM